MTIDRLAWTARTLGRGANAAKRRLPRIWFVTDPDRTPDPVTIAARLPRGAGIIYRAFGRPDAEAAGHALAQLARRRDLVLLVGADEALAARIGAAGLHLPERLCCRARLIRARRPGWLITIAAHGERAARRACAQGADAVLLSTAFASRSPTARRPLGPLRLSAIARRAPVPIVALGGVNAHTARRLAGVHGFAAVEGWLGA